MKEPTNGTNSKHSVDESNFIFLKFKIDLGFIFMIKRKYTFLGDYLVLTTGKTLVCNLSLIFFVAYILHLNTYCKHLLIAISTSF